MRTLKYILFTVFIITLSDCKKPVKEEGLEWSNRGLLDIPSKIRFNHYKKGNLILNPSFEERKYIFFDSVNYTYNIFYWAKEGNNIFYIDRQQDSLISNCEVSDGMRALKISRNRANEFEEKGEGVTSEFIKVIPGTYDFYFDIKLKNIKPYSDRISKNLNDAIDIQVQYFDKNKLPISGSMNNAFLNKNINNSFKGYSFGHFEKIDSAGWIRVKGVSDYYPYNEGLIPDHAKFVKIYIGLKGTGTIWIDNVYFGYSKDNLTLRERTYPFLDSIANPVHMIVPKPQKVTFIDSVKIFLPDSGINLEPFILTENNTDLVYLKAVKTLKKKLEQIYRKPKQKFDIRSINSGVSLPKYISDKNLIISLGETPLYEKYQSYLTKNELKDKKEAYCIHYLEDTLKILFICGSNSTSVYYGSQTAIQLFSGPNLYAATIIDYPDHNLRSLVMSQKLSGCDITSYMEKYKLNSLFKPGNPIYNELINSYPVIYTNDVNIEIPDDNYCIVSAENEKTGTDIYGAYALGIMHKRLVTGKHKTFLIPIINCNASIFNNQSVAEAYFTSFKREDNIKTLWFGVNCQSQYSDNIQKLYYENFSNTKAIFLDNFENVMVPTIKLNDFYKTYPEKIPVGNLLDPYDNLNITDTENETFLRLASTDIFSIFRAATFADYSWNSKNYNPDLSLFNVLVWEFGMEGAKYLYFFNDAFCGLLQTCYKTSNDGADNKTIKSAEKEIVTLNVSFEKFRKICPENKELIDRMYFAKRNIIDFYNAAYEKALIDKNQKEDSTYSSIFVPSK